jgi:hypothetical protein
MFNYVFLRRGLIKEKGHKKLILLLNIDADDTA